MTETYNSAEYPRYRWLILVSAIIGYVTMQVTNLCLAPILPQVARDLAVNIGVATNLMTAFLLSGAVALFFAGAICDRFGILVVIIIGVTTAALPAALMPWLGGSYEAVLWARVVEGLSSGFLLSAMGPIIALWFPEREKGLAAGLMGASVSIGSAIGIIAGPAVFLATGSWRQMCAWLSLFGWLGLAFALILILVPHPDPPSKPEVLAPAEGKAYFKQAMALPLTRFGLIVAFFAGWCLQCLYGLIPGFLSAEKPLGAGFGPMVSGQMMLAVMIAGTIAPILAGILTDKVFKGNVKPVMVAGFGLYPVVIYAVGHLAAQTSVSLLLTALVLAGVAVQIVYPSLFVYIAKSYRPQVVGLMSGLWAGVAAIGGVIGLFLGGINVNSSGSYGMALTIIAFGGLPGLISSLALPRVRFDI
ncbi:MAG: MFS transporter [Deltaproteobacteria bacterium]|nr:MFS transporter [Deltaproteobacteria bacterium]